MIYVNFHNRLTSNYIGRGGDFQDGKTYKCIRNTDIAAYDSLATLATVQGGQYVEEAV